MSRLRSRARGTVRLDVNDGGIRDLAVTSCRRQSRRVRPTRGRLRETVCGFKGSAAAVEREGKLVERHCRQASATPPLQRTRYRRADSGSSGFSRTVGNLVFGDPDMASPGSWVHRTTRAAPRKRVSALASAEGANNSSEPVGVGSNVTIGAPLAGIKA